MSDQQLITQILTKVDALLPSVGSITWASTLAAVWQESRWRGGLVPAVALDDIELADLLHIDVQKDKLIANTQQFLAGLPANNALLWGSRGSGKSSLIHALLNAYAADGLRLVEINREDLASLAHLVAQLRDMDYRFIVFCDDLSFESDDASYKALKSALEGSIFKTAANVLFYATSNRRHLVPEYASDNADSHLVDGELHHGEAVEEKISLSDRFGLWLSFYPLKQSAFVDVVRHWVERLAVLHAVRVDLDDPQMVKEALRWALARGVRNGRTAQYFARHWVGAAGVRTIRQSTR